MAPVSPLASNIKAASLLEVTSTVASGVGATRRPGSENSLSVQRISTSVTMKQPAPSHTSL